jgi:hypothetical protein
MNSFPEIPRGPAFISYSYKDENELPQLKKILRAKSVIPSPFKPIEVTPSEMVSNELIESIIGCQSLIYIDTPNSQKSHWVTLEKEYARHIHKKVFAYEPQTGRLEEDRKQATNFPVYPSYVHRVDNKKVQFILEFMRNKRFFDIFIDYQDLKGGELWAEKIETEKLDRLQRGGYMIVFLSRNALRNSWVVKEVEQCINEFPDQILVALLDEISRSRSKRAPRLPSLAGGVNEESDWLDYDRIENQIFSKRPPVLLYGAGSYGLDYRRFDDLIVWLYWLICNNEIKNT